MASPTLLAAATVDATIALLLAWVGRVTWRRHVGGDAQRANRAFAVWWAGLAWTVLVNALREGLAGVGVTSPPWLAAALTYTWVAALCAAVWGLLDYLVYLLRGHTRARPLLAAFYAGYGLAALALVARMGPTADVVGKWYVQMGFARPEAGGPLLNVMVLLLLLPQILASAGYLALRRRVPDRARRARILLVGGSLLAWNLVQLAAPFLRLGQFEAWQAGGRLVGLAASVLILVAYAPPAPLRRAWAADDPSGAFTLHGDERTDHLLRARDALRARVRDLV